jgi:hypothetical protein
MKKDPIDPPKVTSGRYAIATDKNGPTGVRPFLSGGRPNKAV